MTRIASVETHMISVPRAQPVWTAHERSTAWNVVLTEIRTDDGLVGNGEIHGTPMPQICEWVDRFGELVRGMDALANVAVGKALCPHLSEAWRDRGPRWLAATPPARRARPGDGCHRWDRHRPVGYQGESRRAASLQVVGRGEPADLHLCDWRLLPADCNQR